MTTPTLEELMNDIPRQLLEQAFATSAKARELGDKALKSYGRAILDMADFIEEHAKKADDSQKMAELDRFRENYKQRCTQWLEIRVKFKDGLAHVFDEVAASTRLKELVEHAHHSIEKRWGHIDDLMTAGERAIAEVQEKLETVKEEHAAMKAFFAAFRKDKDIKQAIAEVTKSGLKLTSNAIRACGAALNAGNTSYWLSLKTAEIRRLTTRLEELKKNQDAVDTEEDLGNGIRVVDSPSENRLRVFFPDKPDEETRNNIKARGFRWAPTLGCWQAYRNHTLQLWLREAFSNQA